MKELRAQGRDPRQSPGARKKHDEALASRRAEAQSWKEAGGEMQDPEIFRREILPAIQSVPVRQMAKATGLSDVYCSSIRRGINIPHPRWWETLRALATES